MLSPGRDVDVVVVFVAVVANGSVDKIALGSRADGLSERDAWSSCWCNRIDFGYSPHYECSWPCEPAHVHAQGPPRSLDYPGYRVYALGAVLKVLGRAKDAWVVMRGLALELIQQVYVRRLAYCLHDTGPLRRHGDLIRWGG